MSRTDYDQRVLHERVDQLAYCRPRDREFPDRSYAELLNNLSA